MIKEKVREKYVISFYQVQKTHKGFIYYEKKINEELNIIHFSLKYIL